MRVLITGCHRSGTTLLAAMLSCHPDIAIINEDRYFAEHEILSKKITGVKMPIPSVLLKTKRNKVHISLKVKGYGFMKKVLGIKQRWHIYGACNYCIMDFVEKGRVIFIDRDPEANINSIVSRTDQWKCTAKLDVNYSIWVGNVLRRMIKDLTILNNVYFVTLHELTHSPEVTMRKLCHWLELEYHPGMLSGYNHTIRYVNETLIKKQ